MSQTRTELVRAISFAKASVTQLKKALARHDAASAVWLSRAEFPRPISLASGEEHGLHRLDARMT